MVCESQKNTTQKGKKLKPTEKKIERQKHNLEGKIWRVKLLHL